MKQKRQNRIVELIEKHDIDTQDELTSRLRQDGFSVTQATVSRDIRVLKTDDSHMNDKYTRVLRDGLLSMDMAQNILVIRTVSGMAMAVAAALDAMKYPEIVGCIAGDDTIMAAVRSVEDTVTVMNKIKTLL